MGRLRLQTGLRRVCDALAGVPLSRLPAFDLCGLSMPVGSQALEAPSIGRGGQTPPAKVHAGDEGVWPHSQLLREAVGCAFFQRVQRPRPIHPVQVRCVVRAPLSASTLENRIRQRRQVADVGLERGCEARREEGLAVATGGKESILS